MASILRIDEIVNRLGTGPAKATEGLLLPNVEKAGSGTLDWYEEGLWTPVLTAVVPGTLAATYTSQGGAFTRIGRQVTATFRIGLNTFTLGTASGLATISGLPYAAMALTNFQGFVGACFVSGPDLAGTTGSPVLWMDQGQSGIRIYSSGDNMPWGGLDITGVSAGDGFIGTLTYFAG
jgi:hypothetical protein